MASGCFTRATYRPTFDVAIPAFNPYTAYREIARREMQHLLLIVQPNVPTHWQQEIAEYWQTAAAPVSSNWTVLQLVSCGHLDRASYYERCGRNSWNGERTYVYPDVLASSEFCLLFSGGSIAELTLFDVMKAGCIPVFVDDSFLLPFSEVLDWTRSSVQLRGVTRVPPLLATLSTLTAGERAILRGQLQFYFATYMASVDRIVLTTLHIINDRVFPYSSRSYDQWNEPNWMRVTPARPPLFYPLNSPSSLGFTAVLLTHSSARFPSLTLLLLHLAPAPSLRRIVVVWNNVDLPPPDLSLWPQLTKPVTIVRAARNSLHNRFLPFDEIQTEAVLSLDDDLLLFTVNEIEFAFKVWCEHPDRIVGFPARWHRADDLNLSSVAEAKANEDGDVTTLQYDSEWRSELSMVLTGAAFYHKYYGHLYSSLLPPAIHTLVDSGMSCEDLAINHLIARLSGKAPIKVTPRKKFRCPTCANRDLATASADRLARRTSCLRQLGQIWPGVLQRAEFRADPLLMGTGKAADPYRGVGTL